MGYQKQNFPEDTLNMQKEAFTVMLESQWLLMEQKQTHKQKEAGPKNWPKEMNGT